RGREREDAKRMGGGASPLRDSRGRWRGGGSLFPQPGGGASVLEVWLGGPVMSELQRFLRDRALSLADLPQPPRCLRILCLGARRALLPVKEVSPAHVRHVGRGGKPHKGFCALPRAA